ncbi:MAG: hypothetical protein NTV39_02135 [Candidatus Saccharibacteria bacterium]|nr:hypothetical protein [Candidatus Saccharibacteria bacterium]
MIKELWDKNIKLHLRLLTQTDLDKFCNKYFDATSVIFYGNVRGYGGIDFKGLSQLSLKTIVFDDSLNQDQFMQICHLVNLENLALNHVGKISDLSPISNLKSLRLLSLSTPTGWITKVHHFENFKPIGTLNKLNKISLIGVVADDNDFSILNKLPKLEEIYASRKYDKAILKMNINDDCRRYILKAQSELAHLRYH